MAKQIYYKKYERGTRLQTVDTLYSGGMLYTNTPLAENYSKAFVNYDITTDGTLRSRPGLCKLTGLKSEESFNDKLLISAEPMTTFDTNVTYQHLVVGDKQKTANPENTMLGVGKLSFFKSDGTALDKAKDEHEALMHIHPEVEIHGLALDESLPRYVGCRAFNNDYYWFKPDGKLYHAGYLLAEYNQDNNEATYDFTAEAVEPKECTIEECNTIGFNMLLDNPYTFNNTYQDYGTAYPATVNTITIKGVLPYKDAARTQLELSPQPGQELYFKIICDKIHRAPTQNSRGELSQPMYLAPYCKYTVIIQHSFDNGATWQTIRNASLAGNTSPQPTTAQFENLLNYNVQWPKATTMLIKVTLQVIGSTDTNNPITLASSYITALKYVEKKDTDAINYDLQNYTLKHAEGMTYWKERLILWGVPEDKTMLFVSETRNPSYFPYPNNVSLFDEPIVNVVPLLDNLVVFTTSKIYIMTIDSDYIHLTQKCIQNNLRINPYDVHLMQVVKNMIFFKSGNYYYMIVPKAQSLTGELTIAPVSKNIEYFLDNFKEELYKILNVLYNYKEKQCSDLIFTHYYNYLDYEDVTNVYVFKTPEERYLNFCLLYNTIQRTWRIYVYETANIMQPITHDATKKSIYGLFNGDMYETYMFDHKQSADIMGTVFKNYQLYDSGYRDQEYNLKKRYRELQFIIYNRSLKTTRFGTGFFIDGGMRNPVYNTEPFIKTLSENTYNPEYTGSEQHVELVLNTTFDNAIEIPGTTILGSWILDQSVFPEQTIYKVRFPTSGKGYAPRAMLLNKDELAHDILNTSYVYRSLYSR